MFGDFSSYHCFFIDYLNKHYSFSLFYSMGRERGSGGNEFEHCLHSVARFSGSNDKHADTGTIDKVSSTRYVLLRRTSKWPRVKCSSNRCWSTVLARRRKGKELHQGKRSANFRHRRVSAREKRLLILLLPCTSMSKLTIKSKNAHRTDCPAAANLFKSQSRFTHKKTLLYLIWKSMRARSVFSERERKSPSTLECSFFFVLGLLNSTENKGRFIHSFIPGTDDNEWESSFVRENSDQSCVHLPCSIPTAGATLINLSFMLDCSLRHTTKMNETPKSSLSLWCNAYLCFLFSSVVLVEILRAQNQRREKKISG